MTEPIRITDPADLRIAAYAQVRERDLVGRDGAFIAEGTVVVEKLLAKGRHPLRSVLVAEKRLPALAGLFDSLPEGVPLYAAAQPVMDAIVGFPMHRGVLALGQRATPSARQLLEGLPAKALVMGLLGIANHDNMGGLFRNAAAFGVDAVLVGSDCCDPLYRKAIRVSVGAAITTPFARLDPGQAMPALLAAYGFEVLALSPAGETDVAELTARPRQAVLFGAEGPGLAASVMTESRTVRIPMSGGFDSLNVATSSGIVLHRLAGLRTNGDP